MRAGLAVEVSLPVGLVPTFNLALVGNPTLNDVFLYLDLGPLEVKFQFRVISSPSLICVHSSIVSQYVFASVSLSLRSLFSLLSFVSLFRPTNSYQLVPFSLTFHLPTSFFLPFQVDYLRPVKFEWNTAYTKVFFKLKFDVAERQTIFALNLGSTDTQPPTAPGIADPSGTDTNVVVFDGGLNFDIEYSPSLRKITCAWKEARSYSSCMHSYEVRHFFECSFFHSIFNF